MARVQALPTRAARVGVGVATIVHDQPTALAAHLIQLDTRGPDVELSPKAAGTMSLAVHELTTNALNMVRSRFLKVRSLFTGRLSKSRTDSR